MSMITQHEIDLVKPRILIVGGTPLLHQRLGRAFRPVGISYELAHGAKDALKRLDEGEPPITGVLTDALHGDYPQVIEAAREIGAHAVLMTRSSLTLLRAQQEDIPAYLTGQFAGRTRQGNEPICKLIMDLAPLPEIYPDL
jgi:hypothetical protein